MKLDAMKWRVCKSISCNRLEGQSCTVEDCEHTDIAKALQERREALKAVRDGG